MIEPMVRAFVVARSDDREALLRRLRNLGLLHIDAQRCEVPRSEQELAGAIARMRHALQLLHDVAAAGPGASGSVDDVVSEILHAGERVNELRTQLHGLERQVRESAQWGSVSRAQIDELRRLGVELRVVRIRNEDLPQLHADALQRLASVDRHHSLVACVGGAASLPAGAALLAPPQRSCTELQREIDLVESEITAAPARLSQLAARRGDIEAALRAAEDELSLARAARAGVTEERIFAMQGWLPARAAAALAAGLESAGIAAAVHTRAALPHEQPPTLVRYARWTRPVSGLFNLLGINPGYTESDLSYFFVIAMPLFAGMLIGDAGYGLVFLGFGLFARPALRERVGADNMKLLMLFGCVALVWGALTGAWFGVTPQQMRAAGGPAALIGALLDTLQQVRGTEQQTRDTLIKICFLLGSTHLILAHVQRVLAQLPAAAALADLGWCGILAAMLGVIWNLFFTNALLPHAVTQTLYSAGALGFLLVAGFSGQGGNIAARIAKGVGGAMLPLIAAFGDTLSYIRLAAVGFAGFYLAVATNTLASQAAGAGTWLAGIPVLLIGHSLNIALALVAILAHGVRLNLLEFSGHAGIQWAGYAYRPFAIVPAKEP